SGERDQVSSADVDKIQQVLEHMNYLEVIKPADDIDIRSILVIIPDSYKRNMLDFSAQIVQSFSARIENYLCSLSFYFQDEDSQREIRNLIMASDVVVMVAAEGTRELIQLCIAGNRPHLLVETDYRETSPVSIQINSDNHHGMQVAVQHLLDLGHRRIGFITGNLINVTAEERLQAYRTTLLDAGITPQDELMEVGNWVEASGYEAGRYFLSLKHRPTAIIASNDMMALGAMRAVRETKLKVGKDLSIIGFDDIALAAQANPALTTVRQQLNAMGKMAAELSWTLANNQPVHSHVISMPTELIIRKTTGPAPC
ncbi:MAG TPA: substrate-binding domain-containing protein, partial [Phototrophicaceae bacterium]|nr:substrate-binding domain-containing protein [Phototrophicaceae bacterium]